MQVKDIMTSNPACCTPETDLQQVARMMVEHDCGEIPIVENMDTMRPVGVLTDRDICCRTIAEGKNPLEMQARDCMTTPVVTCTPEMSVEDCAQLMEDHQLRRVPVVDDSGRCCGIVSQADFALEVSGYEVADLVKEVSQPVHH